MKWTQARGMNKGGPEELGWARGSPRLGIQVEGSLCLMLGSLEAGGRDDNSVGTSNQDPGVGTGVLGADALSSGGVRQERAGAGGGSKGHRAGRGARTDK